MFVYYYVHLAVPAQLASARLKALTGLEGEAEAAYREGEDLRARLSPHDGAFLTKAVRLTIGAPQHGPGEISLPITWVAVGTPGLFPRMDADLVLTDLGSDLTQLTFRGSYRPPLGSVGRVVDRTILHRVAESCVKSFVDRLARALTAPEPGGVAIRPTLSAVLG
jgi:hypothetical protein